MAYNEGIHHHLLDLGYTYTHHEADWWEEGSGESGPIIRGGPAWEEYSNDEEQIIVNGDGKIEEVLPVFDTPEEWGFMEDHELIARNY